MENKNEEVQTTKTMSLGAIREGQYGPYLSFDKDIKEISFKREYTIDGKLITELVTIPVNDKGYLKAANIETVEDSMKFKTSKGYIEQEKADEVVANAKEYGIKDYVTVKVQKL